MAKGLDCLGLEEQYSIPLFLTAAIKVRLEILVLLLLPTLKSRSGVAVAFQGLDNIDPPEAAVIVNTVYVMVLFRKNTFLELVRSCTNQFSSYS